MAQGMGEALDEKICTNMICHYGKAGAALSLICDSFDHLLTNSSVSIFSSQKKKKSSVSIFRLYIQTRAKKISIKIGRANNADCSTWLCRQNSRSISPVQ